MLDFADAAGMVTHVTIPARSPVPSACQPIFRTSPSRAACRTASRIMASPSKTLTPGCAIPAIPQVNDPDVLGYLNAENAYFEAAMKPHRGLIDTLFAEMKGRVKDDDASVPQKDGAFVYWHAFDPGAEYRKWYRRPAGGGPDAVILDEPALAAGHEYFRLGGHAVSPDGRLLAYAVDTNGSERFVLKVRDLETGAELPDLIENWRYGLVWAANSKSFLYTDADEHWRSKTVWHHRLGDPQSADRALYREPDEKFGVSTRPLAIAGLCPHFHRRSRDERSVSAAAGRFRSSAGPGLAPQDRPAIQRRRARGHALHPRQRHASQFPRGDGAGVQARRMDRTDRRQRPPLHPVGHDLREPAGGRGARRRPVADPAARLCERRGALCRVPGSELRRRRCPTIPSIASTGCASATNRW